MENEYDGFLVRQGIKVTQATPSELSEATFNRLTVFGSANRKLVGDLKLFMFCERDNI